MQKDDLMKMNRWRETLYFLCALLVSVICIPAANFYVDGLIGGDSPLHGSSPTTPWKTITYALSEINKAGAGPHVLFLVGGQSYGEATNKEAFPLLPTSDLTVIGIGGSQPVIRVPSGKIGVLQGAPKPELGRSLSMENVQIEGGDAAIQMFVADCSYQAVTVVGCNFNLQSTACVNVETGPNYYGMIRLSARRSKFVGSSFGIRASLKSYAPDWKLGVEDCEFQKMSSWCIVSSADYRDTGNRVEINNSFFMDSKGGVKVLGGSTNSNNPTGIVRCNFSKISEAGIAIDAGGDCQNGIEVLQCAFLACGKAIGLDAAMHPWYRRTTRISRNLISSCGKGVAATVGSAYSAGGPDDLILGGNWFENCDIGLSLAIVDKNSINFYSGGDRINGCKVAIDIVGPVQYPVASLNVDSALITNCNGDPGRPGVGVVNINANGLFRLRGSTLADNRGMALNVQGADPASSITHCVFANLGTEIQNSTPLLVTYSCFQNQSVPGSGNLNRVDPRLVRPWYKLSPRSPCLDVGDPSASLPSTDYEGDPRNIGQYPDLGADEYTPLGTIQPYGLSGFGPFGLSPALSAPGSSPCTGGSLILHLTGARDLNQSASAALLILGFDESPPLDLRNLGTFGAKGSALWLFPHCFPLGVSVDQSGAAVANPLYIPKEASLVGQASAFQWVVLAPWANSAGLVTSNALRVTIG